MRYTFAPLTPDRWEDFTRLFGASGACGGCWCMWFRTEADAYRLRDNAGNRREMKKIVSSGRPPGIIAYRDGEPAGWVSLAPREEFPRLERSRVAKPVDERPVWSVVCFYIPRKHRGTGIARGLLAEAVRYGRAHGARVLEAYPVDPALGPVSDDHAYHGLSTWFAGAGFSEKARRVPARPLMRKSVRPPR